MPSTCSNRRLNSARMLLPLGKVIDGALYGEGFIVLNETSDRIALVLSPRSTTLRRRQSPGRGPRRYHVTRTLTNEAVANESDRGRFQMQGRTSPSPAARLKESPVLNQEAKGGVWASVWKLAKQPYYWRFGRLCRTVWTLACNIPTQLSVNRVLSRPAYRRLIAANPRFPLKWMSLYYLARGLSIPQQAECFMHHYRRLPDMLPEDILARVLFEDIPIAEILEGGDWFAVKMGLSRPWDDEGEMSLNFEVNGKMVFVLSFTIVPGAVVQSEAPEVMLISRLQGVRGCYDEIQRATRTMHDVAPPALLLAALCGVAVAYEIRAMAAINATMKPEFHFYPGESSHIQEAYDGFFTELGAIKGPTGFYLSPLPPVEKPMILIKRGHKTRTRAKRALKREIAQRVYQSFREICQRPE